MTDHFAKPVPVELGDGLILRLAENRDIDELAAFNARIHDDPYMEEWTRSLAEGSHPTTSAGHFTVIEDAHHAIVSTVCAIPQTWRYDGSSFQMDRIELVGTDPTYRNRGLIREQIRLHHELSMKRGSLVQALVGRPWYYRQFGYTLALPFGGGREFSKSRIPALKDGEKEAFTVRPAMPEDMPFVADVYEETHRQYLVTCDRPAGIWGYEALERGRAENRSRLSIIFSSEGEKVGYVFHEPRVTESMLNVYECGLRRDIAWLDAGPGVMRYLIMLGEQYAASTGVPFEGIDLHSGTEPLGSVFPHVMQRHYEPLLWYVRVPDMAAFLERVKPVLERRIAESRLTNGHSGDLVINLYRAGLHLSFRSGRLVLIENTAVPERGKSNAYLPPEMFVQLVFGFQSVEDLMKFHHEVSAGPEGRIILETLFPRRRSQILAVY